MVYDVKWLVDEFARGKRKKFLFFWGHQKSQSGELTPACFSQWWAAPFIVEGARYTTAEHWMMAQKALLFGDQEMFGRILHAPTPSAVKALGRQVRGFDGRIWNEKRFEIVVAGNLHKFSQHQPLKTYLQNTRARVLVEASPIDRIWGIGLSAEHENAQNPRRWNGLNLLGFALMTVRDRLEEKD
ncbi:MAG: NADAR family protein [Zoogloeaceae bacterium]|jgi:ribA/ribD-fused uncharacterized protein|nr:NADAR family protein [Zoogloeaceae bacterium]